MESFSASGGQGHPAAPVPSACLPSWDRILPCWAGDPQLPVPWAAPSAPLHLFCSPQENQLGVWGPCRPLELPISGATAGGLEHRASRVLRAELGTPSWLPSQARAPLEVPPPKKFASCDRSTPLSHSGPLLPWLLVGIARSCHNPPFHRVKGLAQGHTAGKNRPRIVSHNCPYSLLFPLAHPVPCGMLQAWHPEGTQ